MSVFKPLLPGATLSARLFAALGATFGILATIMLCGAWPFPAADLPVIVAPLGASAVLVFAVPSSPLAQPWPVVGGNLLSTLVGIAAFRLVPGTTLAAGVAVGGAILVMSLCRCLHPPGGAAALTAVIGGTAVHAAGWRFAFVPMGINSLVLVAAGVLFHWPRTHRYPHRPALLPPAFPTVRLHEADIDAALVQMRDSFDIDRDDLSALLAHAERHAAERTGRAR